MMEDCIFCKIISGEVSAKRIYEDDIILAFHDVSPVAHVHAVIVPKFHINSCNELDETSSNLVSHIFLKCKEIARILGVDQSGYRIINNCGADAGQSVFHIHFHLLGGENLG